MADTEGLNGIRERIKKLPQPKSGDRFEPHLWTDARTLIAMIEDVNKELKTEQSSRRADNVKFGKALKEKANGIDQAIEAIAKTQRAEYFFKKDIVAKLQSI